MYVLGICITLFSIGWSCLSMQNSLDLLIQLVLTLCTCGNCVPEHVLSPKYQRKNSTEKQKSDDDETEEGRGSLFAFYFILSCACCYMAMILTDWVSNSGLSPKTDNPTAGRVNMWCQAASMYIFIYYSIICALLYILGLLLPVCFTNYEFE